MKSICLLFGVCLSISFFACKKDVNQLSSTESNISLSRFLAGVVDRNMSSGSEFGNIYIANREYIDSKRARTVSTCAASFRSQLTSPPQYIGTLKLGNESVPHFSSDNLYLDERGILASAETGNNLSVQLYSTQSDFVSFTENLYISAPMQVSSNLGNAEFFDKQNNLTLDWIQDSAFPNTKTYVLVCCEGAPCILKELDNTSNITIPSTEFSGFQPGKRVYFAVGRGLQKCIEQSNGKSICIYSITYARSIGYTVI